MRCSSPHCPLERANGSRFCETHRSLFASIAAEIDDGKEERRRTPERRRRTMFKKCDWASCTECAAPREAYCEYHLRALSTSVTAKA
jgi:hypothetical protein